MVARNQIDEIKRPAPNAEDLVIIYRATLLEAASTPLVSTVKSANRTPVAQAN
jgi:hypothetical protein